MLFIPDPTLALFNGGDMAKLESLISFRKIDVGLLQSGPVRNGNAAARLASALSADIFSKAASIRESGAWAMGSELRTCRERDADSDLVQP